MLTGGLLFAQDEASDASEAATDVNAATATEAPDEPAVEEQAETPEAAEETTPAPATPREEKAAASPAVESGTADSNSNVRRVIGSLTVFVLAVFVGFEVITKVPPTLHTPLMSGSNAISGITLVGAVIVAATMNFSGFIGFIAVTLATVNAVGGFMVTHRMLAMFKKR
ncbi:MAG: NAD(P) transhydrogenase subunit alpha [Planctomycetales bacterium]|nr:NAD(P) transhydrogenase subunit alpha [Planctomycetales bacterium]